MRTNYIIFFVGVFILISACSQRKDKMPRPKAGILDIGTWNFDREQSLSLDGEWEFYWKNFLNPADFDSGNIPEPDLVHIPGSWNNEKDKSGNTCSTYGYATYRLLIKIPASYPRLGLFIPKVWSAVKVWINGKIVYQTGKISTSYKNYQNKILEKLLEIEPEGNQIELIVQVANFDMFIAGLVQSPKLGTYTKMLETYSLTYTWTLMWIGVLIVMGLYHFVLFFFRNKHTSTLYFGVICLLVGIRLIIFGEHYLYEYLKEHAGWLSFAIQSKVYYITTFALIPLGLVYVKSLYPDKIHLLVLKTAVFITAAYSLFLLFTSPHIFTQTVLYYQVILILFIIYLVVALIRAAFQKMQDAMLQMWGIMAMVIAGINDGLNTQGIDIFGAFELMPAAFAAFLSLQFIILAKRFSKAFKEVEDLSQNLEIKVIDRTKEVTWQKEEIERQNEVLAERQGKLETAYRNIRDSVVYASRIQQSILINQEEIIENFKDAFVLFEPKDIVSGDFYWFEKQTNPDWELKILVAADCTGHGVPGALMTVMGNDFLNEIVIQNGISDPEQILYELDKKVNETLQRQGGDRHSDDGMDLVVITIDESRKKLAFAGAKNPLYYVRNRQIFELSGSKFPIGGNGHFKAGKSFEAQILSFQEGDVFYMSSDGFQDQFGGKDSRKYMKKRFRELLLSLSDLDMSAQKQKLQQELENWRSNPQKEEGKQPQTDDILVIGIQF